MSHTENTIIRAIHHLPGGRPLGPRRWWLIHTTWRIFHRGWPTL